MLKVSVDTLCPPRLNRAALYGTSVGDSNKLLPLSFTNTSLLIIFSAYTMAKYGMSMCVLGMAEEFKDDGIAVNALWPQTGVIV